LSNFRWITCRLCSKVLKVYFLKQSELNALNNSNSKGNIGKPSAAAGFNDELSSLHESEIERELQNLTPVVSTIILPGLLNLDESDVRL
jgi:hypothetical protein